MIIVFLLWRIIEFLIAFVAEYIVPSSHAYIFYIGRKENIFHIPNFIFKFANFDGVNYVHIAQFGYGQYQQTYFPFFPLLMHILSPDQRFCFIVGLLLTNLCFLVGLIYFKKYLTLLKIEPKTIWWVFLFLLSCPTSFFFGAVYTEGIFFFLLSVILYYLQKKQFIPVLVASYFAALTRLIGVFVLIPIFIAFLPEQMVLSPNPLKKVGSIIRIVLTKQFAIPILVAPILGLLTYMAFLWQTQHDPLAFYHSQTQFFNNRSLHVILLLQVYYRYIQIFLHSSHSFIYYVAVVEFVMFNVFFWVLVYDLWKLWKDKSISARIQLIGLNIFSLVNIVLPTLTGTLSSIPRYELFSISFFIRAASMKNSFRFPLLIFFIILHIILLSYFIQGWFIS